jgi:hypothetical protein
VTDDTPFQGLVTIWLQKIALAWEKKNKRFGKEAREGRFFYQGPYDDMYTGTIGGLPTNFQVNVGNGNQAGQVVSPPMFRMTINKVAELVQLFGPNLYYKNPNRKVTARTQVATTTDLLGATMQAYPQYQDLLQQLLQLSVQQNGLDKTTSILVEALLNSTPEPMNLKVDSRRAIDEALITGLGLMWTTVYTPPGSNTKVVRSVYDTEENLIIDPDATSWETAQWIARRWFQPTWMAERKFGLDPGTLRSNISSNNGQAEISGMGYDGELLRSGGRTCDMVLYYEVWSKTGLGSRLKGARDDFTNAATENIAGDYAYLVVCQGNNFPLNAPPKLMQQESNPQTMDAVKKAFMWETPYYTDAEGGGWPCVPLWFHEIPNDPWPASHISFGMGELKFINWVCSWLIGKIRTTCRDFIVVKKALADEFKQVMATGEDLSLLQLTQDYPSVRDAVEFLQHPQMNSDIFEILNIIEAKFDQRTGLNELMYGASQHQYRSAAEAEIKKENSQIRPDDMANRVENWQSTLARREAFTWRWHAVAQDVVPFLGKPGAALWHLLIENQDPAGILYDLQYRIEAGSIRKPNRSRDAENASAILQNLLPIYIQYMQGTGNVDPINKALTIWAKSMDIDPQTVILPPIQPPPPPQVGPGGPPGPGGPQPAVGGPPPQRAIAA